jgi:hypothetical protein
MRRAVLCYTLLLVGGLTFAQQGPPATAPPSQTPSTSPEEGQTSREPMPPDTQAPPPKAKSSERLEGAILHRLKAEPTLSDTNVDAKVSDDSVILTGNVASRTQHDIAVRIAQANAGSRKIIDKLKVKHPGGGS